jgi:hypothetical protein
MGKRKRVAKYPYATDYNDHFETPLIAYRDLLVLIRSLFSASCKSSFNEGTKITDTNNHSSKGSWQQAVVYDPYYCEGRTKTILTDLGFTNVVHEKRDFYKDINDKSVPTHDVLVTNPPYSDQHKEKCLQYCFDNLRQQGTSFCILMPAYVATKQYYKSILEAHNCQNSMIYLVPCTRYEYDHPEGTGKDTSPFSSMWFCGVPAQSFATVKRNVLANKGSSLQVAFSLSELESKRIITSQNRPNPRKRRKMKQHAIQGQEQSGQAVESSPSRNMAATTTTSSTAAVASSHKKKKKRY